MKKIEKRLKDTNQWISNPTIEQVNSMFATVANEMFPVAEGSRPIMWTTYVRQKHQDKKRRTNTEASA